MLKGGKLMPFDAEQQATMRQLGEWLTGLPPQAQQQFQQMMQKSPAIQSMTGGAVPAGGQPIQPQQPQMMPQPRMQGRPQMPPQMQQMGRPIGRPSVAPSVGAMQQPRIAPQVSGYLGNR